MNLDDDVTIPGREASATVITESETTPDETDAEKATRELKEKRLRLAQKQFTSVVEGEQYYRGEADKDLKFAAGSRGDQSYQWLPGAQESRQAANRPALTINRQPAFIRQNTNQARGAHLRIVVKPVDDKGDPKLAEVIQSWLRGVEQQSFADRAYNMASQRQGEIGRGWLELDTEWANDDDSFRQRARIKRVVNALSIYVDCSANEPDKRDANFGFKVFDIDRGVFKDVTGYDPPTENQQAAFASSSAEQVANWFPNGRIRLAKWANREEYGDPRRIAQLSNGRVVPYPTPEEITELGELKGADGTPAPVTVTGERTIRKKHIVTRLISATDIYEETVWPGQSVPWVPILGDEYLIDGEPDYRGVTRDSKPSAMMYNVLASAITEAATLGLKAPVIGVEGQFGKPDSAQRKAWEKAHVVPVPFLEVSLVDYDGKPAPLPQRQNFDLPLEGLVIALRQADQDYKTTAGFHESSLAEQGPQESGKAIKLRQDQDQLGSSHYLDNLRFGIASAGRQLIAVMRVIVDEPTILRITGNDDRERRVMVFSGQDRDPRQAKFLQTHPVTNLPVPFALPTGITEIYDLAIGEFDVEVMASPDQGTRREQSADLIGKLFEALPPEVTVKFLDLFLLIIDDPVARQMAERAKKLLPPELQDQDETGQPTQIPPQVAQQLQMLQSQLQQAAAELQDAKAGITKERLKIQGQMQMEHEELASKERIEQLKIKAGLIQQRIDIDAEKALALLQGQIDAMLTQAKADHTERMAQAGMLHEAHQAGIDRKTNVIEGHVVRQHDRLTAHEDRTAAATEAETARRAAADQADADRAHSATQADADRAAQAAAAPPAEDTQG